MNVTLKATMSHMQNQVQNLRNATDFLRHMLPNKNVHYHIQFIFQTA